MRLAGCLRLFLLLFMHAAPGLAEGTNITGKVTDPQGNAVADAPVSLVADDGKFAQQKATGNDGQFAFVGIVPGRYTFYLKVIGFDSVTRPLVLRDGERCALSSPCHIRYHPLANVRESNCTSMWIQAAFRNFCCVAIA